MSLFIHRADRTDRLADAVAELLRTPYDAAVDPFAPEVVAVPTPGVERWLAQRLSHRLGVSGPGHGDGVSAGIALWSVRRLIAQALSVVVEPDDGPWAPPRLCWPILAELDAAADEPWAAPVAHYLGLASVPPPPDQPEPEPDEPVLSAAPSLSGFRLGRWLATARRLAGLFHSYAVQRPSMITAWLAGRTVDGAGAPLPADRAWQAELFRRVRARIGRPA